MNPEPSSAVLRRPVLAGCFGSLPCAWSLEAGPRTIALAAGVLLCLARLGVLPTAVGAAAGPLFALWLLALTGHCFNFAACRRRSREAGLAVLVVVPESPCVVRGLCRRVGMWAPRRPHAVTVHVDDRWRTPPGRSVRHAVRAFGRCYRDDYDRLLGELAGCPVLVVSSTFNRHESAWTAAADAAGWCRTGAGPLFRSAPARHPPRERAAAQHRMFGGLVSGRRVDRPGAWRTRVFDCRLASTGPALLWRDGG